MANEHHLAGEATISRATSDRNLAPLYVRKITVADLKYALTRGFDDFWEKPSHIVFLCLIYPIVGIFLARLISGYALLPLLFPLMAGFALIGPFAAIGLYELSRRREQGLDSSWKHAFGVLHSPSLGAILTLGILLFVIFLIWLAAAMAIYNWTFGEEVQDSFVGFISQVLHTPAGWTLILVGNSVGFIFAVVVLTISVVSFPLLLDHNVDAMTAIKTSVRAVHTNPGPMALWSLIVAAALVIGSLPVFIGLAIVMPVLGHATWHLYRRVVEG